MKKELFKKSNLGTGLVAKVQPYKYTGKELDRETGLDWYDSQARMLDPTTGRTTTMDPLAEKYYPMSPYLWCGGNPVNSIDIDGKELRIGGVMSEDAFNQLHTKVSDKNFILEMGKDGLVVYSMANTKLSKNQMRIKEIIEDSAISVYIDATNTYETAEGDYFVAGAFGGNQVDNNDFGEVVKVTAKQTVNPCVLEKADTYTGIGTSLMHEITEAYEGLKYLKAQRYLVLVPIDQILYMTKLTKKQQFNQPYTIGCMIKMEMKQNLKIMQKNWNGLLHLTMIQNMKQLFKQCHKIIILLAVLCTIFSCKTVRKEESCLSVKNCFVVTDIKKIKRDVYFIYATRNDSIFKIASYYDVKKKIIGARLSRGSRFKVKLYSQIREPEEKFHIIPNPGIAILFHGVAVTQEPDKNINDVWFSDELSGPYVCQYQTDAEKK